MVKAVQRKCWGELAKESEKTRELGEKPGDCGIKAKRTNGISRKKTWLTA